MLGEPWERLGRRGNAIAHLLRAMVNAWRQSGLHVENMLRLRLTMLPSWTRRGSEMHDKLGRCSTGGRADRQVVLPHWEGAKTSLELRLRHKQTTAGVLNQHR
jgi:hypothetical protein